MQNIVSYFNTFLNVIFGNSVLIWDPSQTMAYISDAYAETSSFEGFITYILSQPLLILSSFVWIWFAVLTVNLLLIFPYKWIRSVIRKCNGR